MAKKKIEKRLWRNLLRTSTILKNILSQCEFLIFFDTETTGLRTDTDKIIPLSAIKTDKDLNVISRFNSYCNPYPMLISPKITEITGITPADVENAPLEKDVVLRHIIRGDTLSEIKDDMKLVGKDIYKIYNKAIHKLRVVVEEEYEDYEQ